MVFVGPDGRPQRSEVLQGVGAPDLGAVDAVAHRALAAARAGGRLVLCDVEPELDDLLRLAGLAPLPFTSAMSPLPDEGIRPGVCEPATSQRFSAGALAVEVEGQPERREQPLRVEEEQEEGHLGDLPA